MCLALVGARYPKLLETPPWGGPSLRSLHEHGDVNAKVMLQCARTRCFIPFPSHIAAVGYIASKAPIDRTFCEYYFEDMPILVPFDIDLHRQCEGGSCTKCCACNGVDLPEEGAFLSATALWIQTFMQDHYGLHVDCADFVVTTACRPEKLSFHVVLPLSLPDGVARKTFRHCLQSAGRGRQIMEKLTGRAVEVVDTAIYSERGQALRGALCNGFDRERRTGKRNWLTAIESSGQGLRFAAWPTNLEEQLLAGMVSRPHPGLAQLPAPVLTAFVPHTPAAPCQRHHDHERGHGPPNSEELERHILRLVGDGSAVARWESPTAVYMRTVGQRRCPHGHVHTSDSYIVQVEGQQIWCICCFTPECGIRRSTLIGELPCQWSVPRERYACHRLSDGVQKPCARPLEFPPGRRCLIEATDMGGGKTEQTLKFISRLPPEESVVFVVHRVLLADSITRRLSGLGFVLYSELPPGPIHHHRVVVCIDSLHRLKRNSFSLVVLDEVVELRRSLPGIETKDFRGGRWNVWQKLRLVASNAERLLVLSAQCDYPEYRLLNRLGVSSDEMHWQMNEEPLLSHLRYRICYTDSQDGL